MNNTSTQTLTPLSEPISSDNFEFDFSMCHGPYCFC